MQTRTWFWIALLGGLIGLLWLLSPILLPFVAGAAIAYLLDPLVDWMERKRIGRTWGTVLALVLFFLAGLLVLLLFVPILQKQVVDLVQRVPALVTQLRDRFDGLVAELDLAARIAPSDVQALRDAASGQVSRVVSYLAQLLSNLLVGGIALVNMLSLIFITPVVAFYLLRDWDRMMGMIDGWLPLTQADTIRAQGREIDLILSGFARGQALLCLSLGSIYAIGLTLIGLDFGLIVGLLAGILSFIPYVGTAVGAVTSLGLAFAQFDSAMPIILVGLVFLVGQVLEGYVLQPWLVGDRVKLHPLWIIFALLAGATLFGFLGVLIAVPVMAVIGVLCRFAIGRYLSSSLFDPAIQDRLTGTPIGQGHGGDDRPSPPVA